MAAGLKSFATWHRAETVNKCRECCGGQGFSSYNRIAELIADYHVDTTFEGDNTVLMQQLTKSMLEEAKQSKSFPELRFPKACDDSFSTLIVSSLPWGLWNGLLKSLAFEKRRSLYNSPSKSVL
jgi:acyl-CoA oxidase